MNRAYPFFGAALAGLICAASCSVSDRTIEVDSGGSGGSAVRGGAGGSLEAGAAGASGEVGAPAAGQGGEGGSSGEAGLGGSSGGSSCDASSCDGTCLPHGECELSTMEFSGHVQHYELLDASYEKGVTVEASDVLSGDKPPKSEPSAVNGSYTLPNLPRGAFINLELTSDQTTSGGVFLPTPLRQTRIATSSISASAVQTLDPQFVGFDWLAQVAVDCGIFATVADATGSAANGVNPFWVTRSTVLVEVRDDAGMPKKGVTADQIEIVLGSQSNTAAGTDADTHPVKVCFLKSALGGTAVQGGKDTATDETGRFVMFRVRNEKSTGFGVAVVRVQGTPDRVLTFRSSGQTGVVQVGGGEGFVAQAPRPRKFETDIYPLFGKYACRGCHSPGNPGFEKSQARGPKKLKADYSGTPDEVYAVLTATDGGDCSIPEKLERVCKNDPTDSLLAHMPFVEPPGEEDHETTLFYSTDDPDYQAIYQWIEQGAPR